MYIYKNYELEHYEIDYIRIWNMKLNKNMSIWNYTIYIQLWIHIYEFIHAHTMYTILWINYKITITKL